MEEVDIKVEARLEVVAVVRVDVDEVVIVDVVLKGVEVDIEVTVVEEKGRTAVSALSGSGEASGRACAMPGKTRSHAEKIQLNVFISRILTASRVRGQGISDNLLERTGTRRIN